MTRRCKGVAPILGIFDMQRPYMGGAGHSSFRIHHSSLFGSANCPLQTVYFLPPGMYLASRKGMISPASAFQTFSPLPISTGTEASWYCMLGQ